MKLTQFDRPILKAIRPTIEQALSVLETEFGVKIALGKATFTHDHVKFQFEMALVGADGQAVTGPAADFKRDAVLYGLHPNDLGRHFVCRGEEFIITGLKPNARKRPVLATGKGNKQYVFPVSLVKAGLLGPAGPKPSSVLPGKRKFGLGVDGETKEQPPLPPLPPISEMFSVPKPPTPSTGVTKRVWDIADKMTAGNYGSGRDRAEVIAACVAEGINPATAATQYSKWRKARGK